MKTLSIRTLITSLCLMLGVGSASAVAPVARQILPIGGIGGPRQIFQRIVNVPKGFTQVVMEQRQGSGWKPVKVQHLNFGAKEKSKVLPVVPPRGVALSQVRMVAYRGAKFPTGFNRGAHVFSREETAGMGNDFIYYGDNVATTNPVLTVTGSQFVTLSGLAVGSTSATTDLALSNARVVDLAAAPVAGAPAVVESDIWKISGNRLFFFNQYRGLQVFDMTHPETPVRTGTLRMAAKGEQMFVLNEEGSDLALLGRSTEPGQVGATSLFLLKVTNGVPALVQEMPLAGEVIDSRLIGSRLYLLKRPTTQGDNYYSFVLPSKVILSAVDLSDPATPVSLSDLELESGWTSHLQASGGYLLVGTTGYYSNSGKMHLVDISTAGGTPVLVKSFNLKGQVQDKFKMGIVNGAAVAVTLVWSWQRQTWVETFPVEGVATAPLAQLELIGARNENLHATRFDGDRLYAVTFRNIDPLFVVDLADPAAPVMRGMLEIPGWSTYLEPLGDRLLAVGLEEGRVTVSLFDVADMTAPTLLSRIKLGAPGTSSWSEATYDEKAVEFFAEDGLVLVPFQTWENGRYKNAMQAIEVGSDALTTGVTILHENKARRGAVMGDHLVSISGQEMLVLNRTTPTDVPEAELSLAWRVDRVVPFGSFLLQLADGVGAAWDGSDTKAMIRVSLSSDPDALVEEIELGAGHIIGTAQKGNRLFVAQWVPAVTGDKAKLRTWVLDLSAPPTVRQVTSVEHEVPGVNEFNFNMSEARGLWVDASTLVWHVPAQAIGLRYYIGRPINIGTITIGQPVNTILPTITIQPVLTFEPVTIGTGLIITGNSGLNAVAPTKEAALDVAATVRKGPSSGATAMLLCPVKNATGTPAASAVIQIRSDKDLRNVSRAYAEGGFIFSSYEEVTYPVSNDRLLNGYYYNGIRGTVRSWLQVVDFNATTPVVRDRVSIPGTLLSVSQADVMGAVILSDAEQNAGNSRVVQASAYDGVSAFQLDTHNLDLPTWNASTSDGSHLFFARGGTAPGVIALGYNGVSGQLEELSAWSTAVQAQTLSVVKPYLLASSQGILETATLGVDGTLTPAASFDTPSDLMLRVDRTAINGAGLWIPASDYGVEFLPWLELQP